MKRKAKRRHKHGLAFRIYHSLVVLPDHLYPFANKVGGQWVRGIRSYDYALAREFKRLGQGRYGFKLGCYRSVFHLLGALLIVTLVAFVSRYFFSRHVAVYIALVMLAGYMTFQEFYYQRSDQTIRKGFVDWFAWVLPLVLYIVLFS